MSDTLSVCGLTICRGSKLRTMLPVPGTEIEICGLTICRGSKLRTMLPVPGTEIEIPLTIINGAFDGPTLLVTAGIHGGEYPGIAAAMELGRSLDPQEIHGSLIMLHPVNIQGFWARREFIVPEDGKNLNRVLLTCTAAIFTKACTPMFIIPASRQRNWRQKPAALPRY